MNLESDEYNGEENEVVIPFDEWGEVRMPSVLPDDANEEREIVQVTREMAIDAGDRKLEGQWIRW